MLYCKIQNLLHALRIVGYKRMIVMQISICHASWVFPKQNHELSSKNVFLQKTAIGKVETKSLRCNFKFINNKIMFMICKNNFKVHGTKRRRTFLLIAKDIFFKYMLHIYHVCENNAVYQCARCKVSIDSKTIKRVSNCNVKSSKGYILVPDDK